MNENDTVATYEIEIGDNDTLSAIVAALIDADLSDPAVGHRRSLHR